MARAKAKTAPRPDRIAPTPERMAKGDVVAEAVRMLAGDGRSETRHVARPVRRTPDPLHCLARDGHIGPGEYAAGITFRRLGLAVEASGVRISDLTGEPRGGGDGAEAATIRQRFRALMACLHETPERRASRAALMLAVVISERPIREVAFRQRNYEAARAELVASLCRVRAALDAEPS